MTPLAFVLSIISAAFIVKFAVKFTFDDFSLVLAFNDDDDTRNKNRDAKFMSRYLYHHLWVRGKFLIHGMGGSVLLITSLLCLMWYHVSGTRGPAVLWQAFFLTQNMMTLGMMTPHMMRKQRSLGFRRFTLQKHTLMVAAHGAMTASTYVADTPQSPSRPISENFDLHLDFATLAAFLFFAMAFAVQIYELCHQYVWSTKDVLITFIPAIPVLHGPFLYQLAFGGSALQELYDTTRIADALYLINIAAVFCVSVDQFLLTIFNRKVISMEQRLRIIGVMWMGFGAFYCNINLVCLVSTKAAIAYTFCVALKYPASWLIPNWCFVNMEGNRKGLYNAENAGFKISPFL